MDPTLDSASWGDTGNPDQGAVEASLRLEMRANEWESRQAVKFALLLLAAPLIVSAGTRHFIVDPGLAALETAHPGVFALSPKQRVEGAGRVREHEQRLRFYAAVGQAPPLGPDELELRLREEAYEIALDLRGENRGRLANVLQDATAATTAAFVLLRDEVGRRVLGRSLRRLFRGLSDTGKAFLIIAVADTVCGYHSEDGWGAGVHVLAEHWGVDPDPTLSVFFVSVVPIVLDTFFKLWLFTGLNRTNPSTVATLKEMDRH